MVVNLYLTATYTNMCHRLYEKCADLAHPAQPLSLVRDFAIRLYI